MNEDQIRQYSRQILLREVGGVGQKKLLAAPIEIIGWSEAIEVAVTYLAAGGSPITTRHKEGTGFLHQHQLPTTRDAPIAALVDAESRSEAPLQVVIGDQLALRTPDLCPACWGQTRAAITAPAPAPVAAGSVGALLLQRHLLGFAQESKRLLWRDGTFQLGELIRCSEHSKSVFPVQE